MMRTGRVGLVVWDVASRAAINGLDTPAVEKLVQ